MLELTEAYRATGGAGSSRVRVAASFRSIEAVRKGVKLVPPTAQRTGMRLIALFNIYPPRGNLDPNQTKI